MFVRSIFCSVFTVYLLFIKLTMATMKDVVCNLLYKTDKLCVLCNQELLGDVFRASDEFVLDWQGTLELHEIFSYIFGKECLYFTQLDAVCPQCSRSAISSYKFLKMCKDNLESIHNALQGLDRCLNSSKTRNDNAVFLDVSNISIESKLVYSETKISSLRTAVMQYNSFSSDYSKQMVIGFFKNKASKNIKNKKHKQKYSLIEENGVVKYKCNGCHRIYLNYSSFKSHLYKFHRNQIDLLKNDFTKSSISVKEEGTQIATYKDSSKTGWINQQQYRNSPRSQNIPTNVIDEINNSICNIVKDDHGKEKCECQSCGKLFGKYKFLVKHYAETHESTIIEENVNVALLSLEVEDICTVIKESDSTRYQCKSCLTTFNETSTLLTHYDQVHGPGNISRPQPQSDGSTIIVVDGITYTILEKNGYTFYQCNICSRNLYLPSRHSRCHRKCGTESKKEETLSICSICGKQLSNKYSLQIHEKTHTSAKYPCAKCKRTYKTAQYLKVHICNPGESYGNPPKKFQCDICNKKFAYKKSIYDHMRYRHLAPGFTCPICSKRFPLQYRLSEHMVVHTKEKNFPCEICNNKFVCKSSLKKHMRLHTGERPYPCQHCERAFMSSSSRAEHVLNHHTVDRPAHECDMCSKVFPTRQAIYNHKKKHFNPNSHYYMPKAKKACRAEDESNNEH